MIYGFVYVWFDRVRRMYYVGSHVGREDDGYVGSGKLFKLAYRRRPQDFKRRIIVRVYSVDFKALRSAEERLLQLIKPHELGVRYYNLKRVAEGMDPDTCREIGRRVGSRPKSIAHREALKLANLGKKKRPRTEEEKRQISLRQRSRKKSPEELANLRRTLLLRNTTVLNKPHTVEHNQNISRGLVRFNTPDPSVWKDDHGSV